MQKDKIVMIEEHDLGNYSNQFVEELGKTEEVHIFSNLGSSIHDNAILLTAAEVCGFKINTNLSFVLISTDINLCEAAVKYYGRIYKKAILVNQDGVVRELYSIWNEDTYHFAGHELHEVTIIWKENSKYIVYEPFVGETFIVEDSNLIPCQRLEQVHFIYNYLEDIVVSFEQMCQRAVDIQEIVFCYRNLEEIYTKREQIGEVQLGMFLIALDQFQNNLRGKSDYLRLTLISFLIAITGNGKYLNDFNKIVLLNDSNFSLYQMYFYWRQQWRFPIKYTGMNFDAELVLEVYRKIYQKYYDELCTVLKPVKYAERNKDRVIVIVVQFLEETHAPTRTALERCATLSKMGKEVLIINTCEQLTLLGMVPIFGMEAGRIFEHYSDFETYQYNNETFLYYQTKKRMPELEETENILSIIKRWNPYLILTMGSGSIVSDLAANIVPVINIPLLFSSVLKKENQLVAVGRKINEEEWTILKEAGYTLDTIIESTFTFDIKQQKKHFTREDFNLPSDRFLLLIVGIRLDYDVQDDFIKAMKPVIDLGAYLVFAGYFEKYKNLCKEYAFLEKNSSFIGYQDDILAINELIDLYINPRRLGGGFSIAEAFFKGKPGITINYGDVAAAAGPDFCVESYQEMVSLIIKYMNDDVFYSDMAKKGLERVNELTDSRPALEYILEEAEKRTVFF